MCLCVSGCTVYYTMYIDDRVKDNGGQDYDGARKIERETATNMWQAARHPGESHTEQGGQLREIG